MSDGKKKNEDEIERQARKGEIKGQIVDRVFIRETGRTTHKNDVLADMEV